MEIARLLVISLASALSINLAVAETACTRITSLAPSVTEVLFELGLGDKIVGVTNFCRYPPQVSAIPKVGGLLDASAEQILRGKPTDVVALRENADVLSQVALLGSRTLTVDHTTISGIKDSYRAIGRMCGVVERANTLVAELERREGEVGARCNHLKVSTTARQRVMVVVGRAREGSRHTAIYISGRDGFYSDLVSLVGGINVRDGGTISMPTLSAEGILKLAPDVIFEVVSADDGEIDRSYAEFWREFPQLAAVRNSRIYFLNEDFASIPGPRYVKLLEQFAERLC